MTDAERWMRTQVIEKGTSHYRLFAKNCCVEYGENDCCTVRASEIVAQGEQMLQELKREA